LDDQLPIFLLYKSKVERLFPWWVGEIPAIEVGLQVNGSG
jgi:hypothetical protein